MSTPPATRRYDGSGRRRDARARQRRVCDAALELFNQQGYGATSIEQIAQQADTSTATVYAAFGNKAGILRRVIDIALAGDDEDVALMDRPERRAVLGVGDIRERMARAVHIGSVVHARSARLLQMVERASATDPALAELAAAYAAAVRTDTARLLGTVAPEQRQPDLSSEEMLDVLVLIAGPLTFASLVLDRGWSLERFEAWATQAVWDTVIGAGPG